MALQLFTAGTRHYYAKIKELHAQFHQEAAKVLESALKGDKGAAEKAIGGDSKYRELSLALTRMTEWQRKSV